MDEGKQAAAREGAWAAAGPLELRLVELNGKCAHAEGTVYTFASPYELPKGLCEAMAGVARNYVWRAALDFPSWEADDPNVYRLHCPSKTGTVWELRKV